MAVKNRSGRNLSDIQKKMYGDGHVQGKIQTHIDQRTAYVPEESWGKSVKTIKTKRYIPIDVAEQIMIENEMLRETLYAHQNNAYNRNINLLMQTFGHSTSEIIKMASAIEDHTEGIIKAQDAFRLVYSIGQTIHRIKFENRKQKESKLQYCWRTGNLPLISMAMRCLKDTIVNLHRVNPHETRKYFRQLAVKVQPKQKKLNKKP